MEIWECCGIFSALFNCDSEDYHLPFLQKVFPCVPLQDSLNIFQVLNHFGCVYGDANVRFVKIKKIDIVISRNPSLLRGNVFRYDVTFPGSNLAGPLYF